MVNEKWSQVKEIFDAVLQQKPEERSVFLDGACSGNEAVRREVESLLSSFGRADGFMEKPAIDGGTESETVKIEALTAGQMLGHYEIIRQIGAGGMGEVYLAKDTKLGRRAALKILNAKLESNRSNVDRFIQEAKAASARNHPNIITIYDIASGDHRDFIAMEYVEGETLRIVLTQQKLDIRRAVDFAAQVASGLASAHAAGIIHRDIKPENLMVAPASQIKILDFGLAKLVERQVALMASNLSTHALPKAGHAETGPGTILGTVAYMSPEQAAGLTLDHRTDIFSLGMVLYEMLVGKHPFEGSSAINILHAITTNDPPVPIELNSRLPAEIGEILAKALAKDPDERYQHAGDFELDLRRFKRALESNSLISTRRSVEGTSGEKRRVPGLWLTAGAGALVMIAFALTAWMIGRSMASPTRTAALENVTLTPLTTDPGYEGEPTFSPDGETIAYVSDRTGNFEIFLKQISGGPDINITNNPADDAQPAFSPDGKQIAFVSTRSGSSNLLYPGVDYSLLGGDIWVMPALGSSARRIAESGNFPSWSPDGSTIIYTKGTAWFQPKMRQVSAQGGEPKDIAITFKTDVAPAPFWLYPSYSSDKNWIAFEAGGSIFVVSAEGGEARRIVKGRRPVWSRDSQALIYSNTDPGKNFSLWQIPFSTAEGTASGASEPLTVGRGRDMQAAVSRDGKMIAFAAQELSFNPETLPFNDETGRQTGVPQPATAGSITGYFLSFSPDARSIAFESHRGSGANIWRVDIGSSPVQLTSDPNFNDSTPRWSPDGKTIAFIRRPANDSQQFVTPGKAASLWLMSSDGANPRLLIENGTNPAWMASGQALAFGSVVEQNRNQLNIFDLETKTARPLITEPGLVPISSFSPDGRWLIFQSNASGNIDLRAIPVEGGEARTVVGTPHQDYHPFVSPSGRWLYFQLDHKNIWRVPGPAQNWRRAEPEKVTNFPESGLFLEDPQISRDGRQLLYSRGSITGDLWIMNLGK